MYPTDPHKSNLHIDLPLEELQRRFFNFSTDDAYEYFFEDRNFIHTHSVDESTFNQLYDKFNHALALMDERNNHRFDVLLVDDDDLRDQLIETMRTDRRILVTLVYGRLLDPLDLYHHPENSLSHQQRVEIRARAKQIIREREQIEDRKHI